MSLIKKWTEKYEEKERQYKQEELERAKEDAKKEHPDGQAWQGEGYLLKTKKGFQVDKTILTDVFQLFSGQKVRIIVVDASADLDEE